MLPDSVQFWPTKGNLTRTIMDLVRSNRSCTFKMSSVDNFVVALYALNKMKSELNLATTSFSIAPMNTKKIYHGNFDDILKKHQNIVDLLPFSHAVTGGANSSPAFAGVKKVDLLREFLR
ncbi:hypothetical protein Ciccas_009085, partial [Cichlidogyrus casuarinus]